MAFGFFNETPGDQLTPEMIQKRRAALSGRGIGVPKDIGSGIYAALAGLADGIENSRLNAAETAGKTQGMADFQSAFGFGGGAGSTGGGDTSSYAPTSAHGGMSSAQSEGRAIGSDDLRNGIIETAKAIGADPHDLATVISYETAGTFDPTKRGPTTQWGQHRGLIQFGQPQAQKYGVDWSNPIGSQLGPQGAIANYLRDAGYKPGMPMLDLYSAINAGRVGRYNASDANNGGAPGTVADKVRDQMGGHRNNAIRLLGPRAGVEGMGLQFADSGQIMNDAPPIGFGRAMPQDGELTAPESAPQGLAQVDPRQFAMLSQPQLTDKPDIPMTAPVPVARPQMPVEMSQPRVIPATTATSAQSAPLGPQMSQQDMMRLLAGNTVGDEERNAIRARLFGGNAPASASPAPSLSQQPQGGFLSRIFGGQASLQPAAQNVPVAAPQGQQTAAAPPPSAQTDGQPVQMQQRQASTPQPAEDKAALWRLANNPWAPEAARKIALQKLTADPMEAEKSRLQLEALRNQNSMFPLQRQQAELGVQKSQRELNKVEMETMTAPDGTVFERPKGEAGAQWQQTLKLPAKPDAPTGNQQELAQANKERQAQGLPPLRMDEWSQAKAKAGATTINNDLTGGTSKQYFDEMNTRYNTAKSAVTGITSLREARQGVQAGGYFGVGADIKLGLGKIAAAFGADPSKVVNTETFRSAIAPQVASMLKNTVGSVNVSNADREFAEKAAGGSIALDQNTITRLMDIMERGNNAIISEHQRQLDAIYPETPEGTFKRERAFFGVQVPPPVDPKMQIEQKQIDPRMQQQPTLSRPPMPAPDVGFTKDGYRFKGGNPADPKSWEKAQ